MDEELEKRKVEEIVKGLKFTCDLHSRGWEGTWIDLVQEIGQLGRLEEEWKVLEWTPKGEN